MKTKIYISFILAILMLIAGCKQMIETNPTEQLDASKALNTKTNIEAATYGTYSVLRDVTLYGRDLVAFADALADNTLHTNVSSSLAGIYNNTTGSHFNNWPVAFDGVNRANLALEAIEKFNGTQIWKDNLAGQLHFLRALLYFDMAKAYGYDPTYIVGSADRGTVPLQTKGVTAVSQMEIKPRASITEMYNFIYKELDSAYAKLKRVGGGGTNPHRVTLSAVNALYARVALHKGDYSTVIDRATEAINGNIGILTNANNFLNGWRAETHPESIFEIKINVNENLGANNSLRATYTTRAFLDSQEPSTHGVLAVGDELYALYQNTDVRKGLIIKGLGNNINRNEMTKFISKGGVKDLDNIPVLRMAEMYLDRAEAYYQLTPARQDLALLDLNKILVSRGLYEVNLSNSALYEEILKQRRLEFAFEGYRWFDLKRLGRNIVKNGTTLSASSFKLLARVPLSEVNSSNRIVQQNRSY